MQQDGQPQCSDPGNHPSQVSPGWSFGECVNLDQVIAIRVTIPRSGPRDKVRVTFYREGDDPPIEATMTVGQLRVLLKSLPWEEHCAKLLEIL